MPSPPDLSDAFFERWVAACRRLDVDPVDLVRVAYSESGCRANAYNPSGHASGVIQFMPSELFGLGFRRDLDDVARAAALRELDAAMQVDLVEAYFRGWAHRAGVDGKLVPQLTSDVLCYVATFLPALLADAIAAGEGARAFVLCGLHGPLAWAYVDNRLLDVDGDSEITVGDLAAHLERQCRGARYDAIVFRMRQAMGESPPRPPEPPPTERELPVAEDDGGMSRRDATSDAIKQSAQDRPGTKGDS